MKDERLYLRHILQALERIEQYAGSDRQAFARNTMAQDAVMRNFEIIGEAVKRVSEGTRNKEPGVPWRAVAGFRDVLIHDYGSIDLNEVWVAVTRDLPVLRAAVMRLLGV